MRRIGEASFSLDKLVGSKESKLDESINENERRNWKGYFKTLKDHTVHAD